MKSSVLIALLLASALPHVATANEHLAGPIAVVIVDNGRPSCFSTQSLSCIATLNGTVSQPGGLSIESVQEISYIGISPGNSVSRDMPNATFAVNGSDTRIHEPIISEATNQWNARPNESTSDSPYRLEMRHDSADLEYFGPTTKNPQDGLSEREFGLGYENGSVIGYDSVGPLSSPGYASTDGDVQTMAEVRCRVVEHDAECWRSQEGVNRSWQNATPNIIFGMNFVSAEVATSWDGLHDHLQSPGGPSRLLINLTTLLKQDTNVSSWQENDISPSGEGTGSPVVKNPVEPITNTTGPTLPPLKIASDPARLPPPPGKHAIVLLAAGLVASCIASAVGLYSRLRSRDEVLLSPLRLRLFELVMGEPGITASSAARNLGVTRTAVRHHLRILLAARLVRTRRTGTELQIYTEQSEIHSPDRIPAQQMVMGILLENPTLSRQQLRKAIPEVPKRTLNHAIRSLMERGAIQKDLNSGNICLSGSRQ